MIKLQKIIITFLILTVFVAIFSACGSDKKHYVAIIPHTKYEFSFDKSETVELSERLKNFLDQIVVEMQNNKEYIVEVTGHSDNTADFNTNKTRALQRANNVADYLKKLGISSDRIKIINMGTKEPITNQNDDRSLALNRRVSIILNY